MPYSAPGERVEAVATRVIPHGAPCVIEGKVGFAAKVKQLDRFIRPTDTAATQIAIGELFTLFVVGTHELALAGGLSAAAVGEKLWIDPDDDVVKRNASAAAGDLPLGVIDEIDVARTPDVARVNMNNWQAFIIHA